jgi:peptidoglycan-associated lipoprotein
VRWITEDRFSSYEEDGRRKNMVKKEGRVVVKRGLGLAIVCAALVGCADTKGPAATSNTDFGKETPPPAHSMSTADSSMFRTIYFDFDKSDLRADAREGLQSNATYLKGNSSAQVTIEGNTDERGSNEYNLALGKRRADAAYKYLVDLGVDSSRMTTVSYGEEKPAVEGHNELAWAKNRRDDFKAR